jgi:hypothetical protein
MQLVLVIREEQDQKDLRFQQTQLKASPAKRLICFSKSQLGRFADFSS